MDGFTYNTPERVKQRRAVQHMEAALKEMHRANGGCWTLTWSGRLSVAGDGASQGRGRIISAVNRRGKDEIFWDGERSWNITALLEAYPELLDTPTYRLRLDSTLEQGKQTFVLPEGRLREPDLSRPVIVTSEGVVIDGWARIEAALAKGRKTFPAVKLTPEQEESALRGV